MKSNNLQKQIAAKHAQELSAVEQSRLLQKQRAEQVLKQLSTMYPQVNGVRRIPKIA